MRIPTKFLLSRYIRIEANEKITKDAIEYDLF